MPFHQLLHHANGLFASHVLLLWLLSLGFVITSGLWLSRRSDRMVATPARRDNLGQTTELPGRVGFGDGIAAAGLGLLAISSSYSIKRTLLTTTTIY
jgi:hypothetical protein